MKETDADFEDRLLNLEKGGRAEKKIRSRRAMHVPTSAGGHGCSGGWDKSASLMFRLLFVYCDKKIVKIRCHKYREEPSKLGKNIQAQ
jgi:hypothetical protein